MTTELLFKLTEDSIRRSELYHEMIKSRDKTQKETRERKLKIESQKTLLDLMKYWVKNEENLIINESDLFTLKS